MRKILSAILSFVLGMSSFVTAASAENRQNARVEISFRVGDSVLMINGEATEVETPYIAGEGTTLVPLRVITEAFGAEVTWVDETKEIYLSCPDVSIVLQIGNSEAKINAHTETLPEAPALSPNGVTMVPLRFISETFGAEVGYDEKTAAITVVKEASGETAKNMNDMPRVGDSYYDLSTVDEEGYRLFEDEELKVSFKVPAECVRMESLSANDVTLATNEAAPTIVSLYICSKAEARSARLIAEFNREFVREHNDETDIQVSDVYSYDKISVGDNACAYTVTTVNRTTGNLTQQIIYFEKGEYVYQFKITCPVEKSSVIDTIVSSIKAEELGENEFGAAMRDMTDATGNTLSSLGECELTLPPLWEETDEVLTDVGRVYAHQFTDSVIEFTIIDDADEDIGSEDARDWANYSLDSLKKELDGIEYAIEKNVTKAVYGGKDYYTYAGYIKDPTTGERIDFAFASLAAGGKIYQFTLINDAGRYGEMIMEEFESIIGSLEIK